MVLLGVHCSASSGGGGSVCSMGVGHPHPGWAFTVRGAPAGGWVAVCTLQPGGRRGAGAARWSSCRVVHHRAAWWRWWRWKRLDMHVHVFWSVDQGAGPVDLVVDSVHGVSWLLIG